MSLMSVALTYAARGFPVGPVCRPSAQPGGCSYSGKSHRPHCPDPGKKPIPYAGIKGYTTDPDRITQWWQWYPSANLGLAMGMVSGYFVMEADGPAGLSFLQEWHLPPTPTLISSRGIHQYLKIPPGYSVMTAHLDQLDIIGNGDQVVGPGSVHRSGHVYAWQEYLSFDDIDPAEPPSPLISWLSAHRIFTPKALASPKYPQMRPGASSQRSPATRALRQRGTQPRLTSGEEHDGEHRDNTGTTPHPARGGYKTRSTTTRLVAPPVENLVVELAHKPEIQAQTLMFFGLDDVVENRVHLCRIPGHRERRASAVLRTGNNGYMVYECLHAKSDELKAYIFPDLYRAWLCGHAIRWDDRLTGPALVPWWERLLIAMGALLPVTVPHRAIVEAVAPSVHQVYDDFVHLLACRWNYEYGQPTTFSVRFGMEWCGIGSHHTFRDALHWLVQHRYIDTLPAYTSKAGKSLVLYLPGTEQA